MPKRRQMIAKPAFDDYPNRFRVIERQNQTLYLTMSYGFRTRKQRIDGTSCWAVFHENIADS